MTWLRQHNILLTILRTDTPVDLVLECLRCEAKLFGLRTHDAVQG